jgi:large subunit ribosomal protein L35
MPKKKTHRGAAKRFEVTGTGKIRRRRAFANHLLGKKPSKRKRRLNSPAVVADADRKRVRRLLGR